MKTRTRNIAIILCLMSTMLSAKILYVDQHLSDGFWVNSYAELSSALRDANSGDEIWVAKGEYLPGREKEDSFVIKPGVKLYGGFYGGETKLSDRELNANLSILSGEIGDKMKTDDNCLHVILCCQTGRERLQIADERERLDGSREPLSEKRESFSGRREPLNDERERSDESRENLSLSQLTDANEKTSDYTRERTVIDGFTIRNGNAKDSKGGGGIFSNHLTPPLIQNCRFINNQSTNYGGAIAVRSGIEIVSCYFGNNTSTWGGAICADELNDKHEDILLLKSSFISNSAKDGAVMCNLSGAEVKVDSCIMVKNHDTNGQLNSFCSNGIMKNYYQVINTATDDEAISRTQNIHNISYVLDVKPTGYFLNKGSYQAQNMENIPKEYGYNFKKRHRLVNLTLLGNDVF